jgi:hypothetical protein
MSTLVKSKEYYIYGLRPVYKEEEKRIPGYFAFDWTTGEFKEDMSYFGKIYNELSGNGEEIGKEEFDR